LLIETDGSVDPAARGAGPEEWPAPPVALGRWYARWGKRLLDLALTVPAFLLVSPILLVLACLVRIFLGQPVFFRQERPGLRGRLLTLYKFRTMTDERDRRGILLPDSRRLTRFGRFLRSTSLDELPELMNVIRGDMSLVGPRPLLVRYYAYFRPPERVRFLVLPGITGFSQIQGRNDLSWDMRIALDVAYVERCSLGLDVKILLKTFWRVVRRDGLRVDPGATMLDFDEERRRVGRTPRTSGR
jgi:lipopolysaccharide/colanic/teichoic acid biosynthesis glycosyltransferase